MVITGDDSRCQSRSQPRRRVGRHVPREVNHELAVIHGHLVRRKRVDVYSAHVDDGEYAFQVAKIRPIPGGQGKAVP